MIDPRGIRLFIVDIIFLGLTWLFFSLRALVTLILIRSASLDDILMFASILIYTAHNTISVWGIVYASQASRTNPLRGESIALHSWFLCEVIYAPLSALVRTSIALFLLRIATVKWHRYTIYGTLAIVWALSIPFFFILLFQCNPPRHFYEQVLNPAPSGTCINHVIVPRATIAHSIIGALMDFVLALLPIAILWNVKLSKRTKAGVAALLGMGLFAGIALIVRIPYIKFTPISSSAFLGQTNDAALWSILEASFGIIAGCAATLRPLVASFPSRRRSKYRYSARPGNNNFHGSNHNRRHPGGTDTSWSKQCRLPRRGRVGSQPTSLSTADSSRLPGWCYEMDSDPDFTREMKLGGYENRYGHGYGNSSPGNIGTGSLRDSERDRGSSRAVPFSPSPSVVHVQTSIEVTSGEQGEIGRSDMSSHRGRIFPLQGDRVVTINGPVSQGLSTHTY